MPTGPIGEAYPAFLEGPQLEPARARGHGPVEKAPPYPQPLRVGAHVQVFEGPVLHEHGADNPAVEFGRLDPNERGVKEASHRIPGPELDG